MPLLGWLTRPVGTQLGAADDRQFWEVVAVTPELSVKFHIEKSKGHRALPRSWF